MITKKIDDLGRIVIPKDIRNALGVKPGDAMSFVVNGDELILSLAKEVCCFCKSEASLTEFKGKHICASCKSELSENE